MLECSALGQCLELNGSEQIGKWGMFTPGFGCRSDRNNHYASVVLAQLNSRKFLLGLKVRLNEKRVSWRTVP